MSELTEFLVRRYGPLDGRGRPTIELIEQRWAAFKEFADSHFVQEFCTENPEAYQQRYWELYLGAMLVEQGFALKPNSGHGPDLGFDLAGRAVWVEAISPGPGTGANRIPEMVFHDADSPLPIAGQEIPAPQRLLRYTAAIEEKARKYRDYIRDGIVAAADPFIIAIDVSQLGDWGFDGASTFPAVLEAVFPIGAMQVHFPLGGSDRQPMADLQHRPAVRNSNNAEVVTTRFIDANYSGISGILCSERNDGTRIPPTPMIFVHNKVAANPLNPSPVRVNDEYLLEDAQNGYTLRKIHNVSERGDR